MTLFESHLEEACLAWFAELGHEVLERDHLDPESAFDERRSIDLASACADPTDSDRAAE